MWEPAVDLGHPERTGKEREKEGRKKDPTAKVKCLLSQDHTAGQTGPSGESLDPLPHHSHSVHLDCS